MEIISLSSLLEADKSKGRTVQSYLSSFVCKINPDAENYLHKKATSFITILIAQLGRSDLYKGKVSGSEILEFALERCSLVNELSAIKIACVEYENNANLVKFYEDNDFKVIQKNDNGYTISYVRL